MDPAKNPSSPTCRAARVRNSELARDNWEEERKLRNRVPVGKKNLCKTKGEPHVETVDLKKRT